MRLHMGAAFGMYPVYKYIIGNTAERNEHHMRCGWYRLYYEIKLRHCVLE